MMQKIRETFLAAWHTIVDWLAPAGKLVFNISKVVSKSWRRLTEVLINVQKTRFYRIGIQIFMGIAIIGVLSYLIYAGPANQSILYLLFVIISFLDFAFVPPQENAYQFVHYPIRTGWWVFLGIAFFLPIYIIYLHEDLWMIHWRIISLNTLVVPILLFVRQNWPETWSDNRWLIMPATLIALWWINSSWIITYETSLQWQKRATSAFHESVYISYPTIVRFDSAVPQLVTVWCDDTIICGCHDHQIILYTTDGDLLFSAQTDPPNWKLRLPIKFTPPEIQHTISFQYETGVVSGPIDLWFLDSGNRQRVGTIYFETEVEAQTRNFWLTLLQGGSIAVTALGALYAGLKQWDERRRKEEKELQKELLGKFKAYSYVPGQISQVLNDTHVKLATILEWDSALNQEFVSVFGEWIKKHLRPNWSSEIALFPEAKDFIDKASEIWDIFSASKPNNDLETIKQRAVDYTPILWVSYYPPENYPVRKLFLEQIAHHFSDMVKEESYGPEQWMIFVNPFIDWDNPFAYGETEENRYGDFPLLKNLEFPFLPDRFSHQEYYFSTDWDVRAAFYSFCTEFILNHYRSVAQKTLFVPMMPENWEDGFSLQSCLLHCLAERWLEILTKVPRVADELESHDQERLASLLLWRYRSGSVIRHKIAKAEQDKDNPIAPVSRDFLKYLEQPPLAPIPSEGGDLLKWLALRPAKTYQTMFLYVEASPANAKNQVQADCLRSINHRFEIEMEQTGIYLVRFLKSRISEKGHVTKVDNLQHITSWFNSRIQFCLRDEDKKLQDKGAKLTFSALFPNLDMEKFIEKAEGSPGQMVMMANDLIEPYLKGEKDPAKLNFIDTDTLLARLKF